MSFEDGLKVVKVRAESMSAAAKLGRPHGMLSVVGLGDADLDAICAQVRAAKGGDSVCQLANYLFPQGRVVSGWGPAWLGPAGDRSPGGHAVPHLPLMDV